MDKKKATTSYTTHKRGSLITYTKDEKKSTLLQKMPTLKDQER